MCALPGTRLVIDVPTAVYWRYWRYWPSDILKTVAPGGRSGGGSSGAPSDVSDEAATSATPANIDRRKLLRDAIELDDLRLKKPRKHRQLTFTQQVS